jgi:hypothetical protein
MEPFEFHGELFEFRGLVLETLAANGFVWMADFGSVDLRHESYGLEVTGIHEQDQAMRILQLLKKLLPDWRFYHVFYEEHNRRERGWKVIISRKQENVGAAQQNFPSRPTPATLHDLNVRHQSILDEMIETTSSMLANPNLSDATRAELQKRLDKYREMKRKPLFDKGRNK